MKDDFSDAKLRLLNAAVDHIAWTFDDVNMATDAERQYLARLMYLSFCDLRVLTNEGRNEQANALADAFHNVPLLMFRNDFSFRAFRDGLRRYQESFRDRPLTDYLEQLDKMIARPATP